MKLKKSISLLFLAVYLMATAGPAYVSLSCHCIAKTEQSAQASCHQCQHCEHHHDDAPNSREAIRTTCCGDHHSTEIELYTGFSDNNEKLTRCTVVDLPPAIMAEATAAVDVAPCCETFAPRHAPPLRQVYLSCAGLRAPPVLA